jgi:hypothetical protein
MNANREMNPASCRIFQDAVVLMPSSRCRIFQDAVEYASQRHRTVNGAAWRHLHTLNLTGPSRLKREGPARTLITDTTTEVENDGK